MPLGYNPHLDKFIESNTIGFDTKHYLKRISSRNEWVETDFNGIKNPKYSKSLPPHANELFVGIINTK